jgi:hypothetical protein
MITYHFERVDVHFISIKTLTLYIGGSSVSEDVRFYKGKHRVKVMTKSTGGWIVEAVDAFDDVVNEEKVHVKAGQRRIVAPNLLFKRRGLPPPVREHVYELKMEKKLKQLVEKEERDESG